MNEDMEMNLHEKLANDLKIAMRARDDIRLGVIRMVISSLHKKLIEKRSGGNNEPLTEEEEIMVLRSEAKKRREAQEAFYLGGRSELAEKEKAELIFINSYLPPAPSDQEIELIVKKAITKTNATSVKDSGIVMKEAMRELKGRVEGGVVAGVIKKIFS